MLAETNTQQSMDEETQTLLPSLIYRFKFTETFMTELYQFSKIHQYDDRVAFKDAWSDWLEANSDVVDEEIRRLINLGYDGDVIVKMYKSARYYFRKKSDQRPEPKKRRCYVSVTRDLLDAMDTHIASHIYDSDYQPKNGFVTFCKDNETLLRENVGRIFEQGICDQEQIQDKIKKTYKNRYFILTKR